MLRHRHPASETVEGAEAPASDASFAGDDPFYAAITGNSEREAYAETARARRGAGMLTSAKLDAPRTTPELEWSTDVGAVTVKLKFAIAPRAKTGVTATSDSGAFAAASLLDDKAALKVRGAKVSTSLSAVLAKAEVGVSPLPWLKLRLSAKFLEFKASPGRELELALAKAAFEISASGREICRLLWPDQPVAVLDAIDVTLTGTVEVPVAPEDVAHLIELIKLSEDLSDSADKLARVADDLGRLEDERRALLAMHGVDDAAKLPAKALLKYRGIEGAIEVAKLESSFQAHRLKAMKNAIAEVLHRLKTTSGNILARAIGDNRTAKLARTLARIGPKLLVALEIFGLLMDLRDIYRVIRADRAPEALAGPAPDEPGTAGGRGDDLGGREADVLEATREGTPGAPAVPGETDAPRVARDAVPATGVPAGTGPGKGTGVGSPTATDVSPDRPSPEPETYHGTPAGAAGTHPVSVSSAAAAVIGVLEAARGETLPPTASFEIDAVIPGDLTDDELAELERRLAGPGEPIADLGRLVPRLRELVAAIRKGRPPVTADIGTHGVDETPGAHGSDDPGGHGEAGPATIRGLLESAGDLLDWKGDKPVVNPAARKKLDHLVGDGITIRVSKLSVGKVRKPGGGDDKVVLVPVAFTVNVLAAAPGSGLRPGKLTVALTYWLNTSSGSGPTVTAEEIHRGLRGALTWADGTPTGVIAGKVVDIGMARVRVVDIDAASPGKVVLSIVPIAVDSADAGLTLPTGWTKLEVGVPVPIELPLTEPTKR